jgi:hypothetical protein
MAMDSLNGITDNTTTVNGKTERNMVVVCGALKKVTLTLVNGFLGEFRAKGFTRLRKVIDSSIYRTKILRRVFEFS